MKLKLPNVSLCIIDTINYSKCITALRESMKDIEFGEVLIVSDVDYAKYELSSSTYKFIKIDPLKDTLDYSKYITKELPSHINLDYVLIVQWDGYILNKDNWQDSFLDYDYIGAEWAPKHWNYYTSNLMGNGGFSLRSKKLMDMVMNDDTIEIKANEDACIGYYYKEYLENKGIKFAPVELARKFSFEEIKRNNTFGFHGEFNIKYMKCKN